MTLRVRLTCVLLALGCFGASILSHHAVDETRPVESNELLYLPNERLLTHFTAGMSSVIADLLWLRCIQYVAEETKGAQNYEWLSQMLFTVTRLDPYFVDAYRLGGLFLAALKSDDDTGLKLLHAGIIKNPHRWELPNECAMIYLLNRRDQPEARQKAAGYLTLAATTGTAPPLVADLAAKLHGQYNMVQAEFEMWSQMLESDDQFMRELAEKKLRELQERLQSGRPKFGGSQQ